MKGDFSRLTFDPRKHFSQVFSQQGRVQLDADWNEQAAILRHFMERLAADLIGPYAGPVGDVGFGITLKDSSLTIGKGRYYVDGLLVENPEPATQTFDPQKEKFPFLVYLDAWERHITYIEDGRIREVALEGPDTSTRAQVVWQVRVTDKMLDGTALPKDLINADEFYSRWVKGGQLPANGSLKAQAKPSGDPTDPCVASPDALYRGLENQLYRVEVHTPGLATTAKKPGATFKWSRDNGSVAFAIVDLMTDSKTSTTTVSLADLGHEGRPRLAPGDWVEIVDDDVALGNGMGPLLQVGTVDSGRCQVTLQGLPNPAAGQKPEKHPLLRRWDQGRMKSDTLVGGAVPIVEGTDKEDNWIELEDGVQVAFQPATTGPNLYRTGDYWLIPARTVTGDVEWPRTTGASPVPVALPPHGVRHRYAPLALVTEGGHLSELHKQFSPMWSQIPPPSGTTTSQGTANSSGTA